MQRWLRICLLICAALLAACSPENQPAATATPLPELEQEIISRDADVPALPFPDNPDPDQCGIPIQWGSDNLAWLNGRYAGELIEPQVHLYDSHLRLSIKGSAPHGSQVEILLYQENPVLDYYLVRTTEQNPAQEGWVPAAFISFTAVK